MKVVVKAMKSTGSPQVTPQPVVVTPKAESPVSIPIENLSMFYTSFAGLANGGNSVPGKQAVEFFTKSNLPIDFLKKVWELCDYKKEGALKKMPFCAAMYFITQKRKNPDFVLPTSLPSSITEEDKPILAPVLPTNSPTPSVNNSYNSSLTTPRGSLILENRVNTLMKESSMLKEELFNTNSMIQDQTNKIDSLKETEKNYLNEIRNMQLQLEETKTVRQKLLLEQSQVEARLLALREEQKGNSEYLESIRSELDRLNQIKTRGEQSIQDLSTEVEHQASAVQSEAQELESKKAEIIKLKKQYEMLMIRKRDAEEDFSMSQLGELKDEIRKLKVENDDLELKVVQLEGKNKEALKSMGDNEKIAKEYRDKNADLKSKLQKAQKEMEENTSKPNMKSKVLKLKDLTENANRCILEMNKLLEGKDSDFTVDENLFKKEAPQVNKVKEPEVKKVDVPKPEVKETPKPVVKEVPKPVVTKIPDVPKPVVKEIKQVPPPAPVVDDFAGFDDFGSEPPKPSIPVATKTTKTNSTDFDFENEFNGFDDKKGGSDPWSGFDDFEFSGNKPQEKKPEVKAPTNQHPPAPVSTGFGDDFDAEF